jgi:hypothetical protein
MGRIGSADYAQQQGREVLDTPKTLLKAEWAGKNIGLLTEALPADTSYSTAGW